MKTLSIKPTTSNCTPSGYYVSAEKDDLGHENPAPPLVFNLEKALTLSFD